MRNLALKPQAYLAYKQVNMLAQDNSSRRPSQLRSVSYRGLAPGSRLLVLGAVHGNEVCGTQAIRQILQEIDSGELALQRGSVTFVPVTNPLAYQHQSECMTIPRES